MNFLSCGAEAVLFLEKNVVIKERITKKYRVKELDKKIRKFRTKREAKILQVLNDKKSICPKLISFCDKKMIIEMEYLEGVQLKEVIKENFAEQAGKIVALMHENDIIHYDLTTANFIVKNDKVFIIDFGLSFFSKRIEDKAVDLHLFERSLNAYHTLIKDQCWNAFLKGYKNYKDSDKIIKQLKKVELRGRNK